MAAPLSVKPRDDVFSISQTEPDESRPIFAVGEMPEAKLPAQTTSNAPAGMISVDELPLDQQAEFYSQVQAAPAPKTQTGAPAGMLDAVEAYKGNPKALFDLSVGTKGKFSLDQWALDNPDRVKDPEIATTIADAMAMEKERGFRVRDIDWKAAGTALLHLPVDIAKWAGRGHDLIQAQVDQLIAEKPLTGEDRIKFDTEQKKRAAELVAGTDVGLQGLAGLVEKAGTKPVRKIAEWTGLRAKPTERTPEEKLADMNDRIDAAKRRELTARGNGVLTQTFLGGVMQDLERDGVKLDPEAVATFAAGDPVTFAAFGEGFKIVGAAGRSAGKVIGSVTTRGQALRAMEKLNIAQQVAAKAGFEHKAALDAAGKALEIPPGAPIDAATLGAFEAAAVTGKTAAQAEADYAAAQLAKGGPTTGPLWHVANMADAAANIADWAKSIVPGATDKALGVAAGMVGGAARVGQFGTWALRGVAPAALRMRALNAAPGAFGKFGDYALERSRALLKNTPERFGPFTQLASDAAKVAAVDVPSGMVKGGVMDYTLAAITNETPTENANTGLMMAAFGGLSGLRFGAGRLVKGQMTALHNYSSDSAVRNLGNFPDLDAATELSLKTAEKSPGTTRRLAAMREFFGPANTEMHFVSDPQQFADVLRKYVPSMSDASIEQARAIGGVNLKNVEIPGTGKTKNLSIFNELSAAEHEGIHGWQDIFSSAGREKLFQLARNEYGREWEQIGNGYTRRFVDSQKMNRYASRGESWREALIDFTQGSAEWRDENWSPDRVRDTADKYIANEIVADVGASILQSNRGNLEKAPGFPGKLARIIGSTMDKMGMEPFAGEVTPQVEIPLKVGARERIRLGLRDEIADAGTDAIRAKFDAAQAGKPVSEKAPVSPAGASATPDEIVASAPDEPTVRGGRTQREIAGDLASAINAGAGVSIDYMSAPGEPAGAVTSNRAARRDIIEAFRTMPAEARALWEKTFFPERLTRTNSGAIQIQGWSPEVFAANAHKLAAELHKAKAGDLTPYPIDPKTGTFTADGWRLLFDDTVQYSKNQMAGLTGAGEPLVVPKAMAERGFTQPTELGEPGRKLTQDRADVISMLMGIPLPKTGRIGKVFPRNLAGQAVSAATKPGRVSNLVEPRTFTGPKAEALGIEGESIREVNPLRAELDLRGIKPSLIEAIQKLNLANIADVTPNANLPVVRGREFTIQAGFAPKSAAEWAKLGPADLLDELKFGGKPLTPTAWEVGKSASIEEVKLLRSAMEAASAESNKLRAEAMKSRDMAKIDDAMRAAMAKQFFSEAVQMAEGTVIPDPVTQFAPKTEAGKSLAERGFSLEHAGYPGFRSISVLKDGKHVGEISSTTSGDAVRAYIAGVSVVPSYRNQGIADALYRELFTDLQSDGITRVDGFVVHPAPIKSRDKILGQGMTRFYASGNPVSIKQALSMVAEPAATRRSPRAVSTLAPGAKFAPKHKIPRFNKEPSLMDDLMRESRPPKGWAPQPEASTTGTGTETNREFVDTIADGEIHTAAFHGTRPSYGEEAVARGEALREKFQQAAAILDAPESDRAGMLNRYPYNEEAASGLSTRDYLKQLIELKNEVRWKTGFYKEPSGTINALKNVSEIAAYPLTDLWDNVIAPALESSPAIQKYLENRSISKETARGIPEPSLTQKAVGMVDWRHVADAIEEAKLPSMAQFPKEAVQIALEIVSEHPEISLNSLPKGTQKIVLELHKWGRQQLQDRGINPVQFAPSRDPRAIKEAAVKFEDGKIFYGTLHSDAYDKAEKFYSGKTQPNVADDGFVTNSGEYLSRDESGKRAVELKQITSDELAQQNLLERPGDATYLEAVDFDNIRRFAPKPNEEAREVAEGYAKSAGIVYVSPKRTDKVDEDTAREIADFYESAKHDPANPEVQASYNALIAETKSQYKSITDAGYTIEPWAGKDEPYKSSDEMAADVRDNKHLYYLPTKGNFSGGEDNPMLEDSGVAPGASNNDLFRAVHDFYGHAVEGSQFGAVGELNAWKTHSELYSPDAQGALAAETLAQNSWVNFGKHVTKEMTAKEKPFAEQKAVVIPQELIDKANTQFAPKKLANAANDQKFFDVEHLSSVPGLKEVNPKYFGRGKATTTDMRGGNKSFFFVKGSNLGQDENIFGHGDMNKYEARIPGNVLYDLRKGKPDPIGWRATVNREEADDNVSAAGYKGMVLDTADGRQIVAMFSKTPVNPRKDEIEKLPRFAPKPGKPILGMVDEESGAVTGQRIPSLANADYTHANMSMIGGIPWRYNPENNTLYWWEGRGAVPESLHESVLAWLDKKGYPDPKSEYLYTKKWAGQSTPKNKALTIEAHGGNESAAFAPRRRGETEGLPGLDIPREYLTPAERGNMTRQEVRDRFPEAVVPRANNETIPSNIIGSPLYKQAGNEVEAVKLFADRLVEFAKEYEDRPEYALGAKWYSEFTPKLKKEFGADAPLMAELLAATSPQTGVEVNFGYAFDALQSWKAGRFAKIIPKFEQGLAKMEDGSWETWLKRNKASGPETPANFMAHWIEKNDLKPTQSNGKLYGQHSIPVLKVFARRWMDSNEGPKTRNFVGNLLGKSDEATIDLWADRSMRWAGYEGMQDRWRILPENLHSVSDADYNFSAQAFRAAAKQLNMKPSALQGALWFAEKKRWSDNGWGRLDLGNFQTELEKIPLLKAGFEQRLQTQAARGKTKPTEQLDIFPRFP